MASKPPPRPLLTAEEAQGVMVGVGIARLIIAIITAIGIVAAASGVSIFAGAGAEGGYNALAAAVNTCAVTGLGMAGYIATRAFGQ